MMKHFNDIVSDGVVIKKSILNSEECLQLRHYLMKSRNEKNSDYWKWKFHREGGSYSSGDILADPKIRELINLPYLATIICQLLGEEKLYYFGDSQVSVGSGATGFHRDNVDREYDVNKSDWKGEYSLFRVGLYLFDTDNNSGGLEVKLGSHVDPSKDKITKTQTKIGDLLLWNMRLLHSGNSIKYRFFSRMSRHHLRRLQRYFRFLEKTNPSERCAIFVCFATRKDPHLSHYLEKHMLDRDDMKEHTVNSKKWSIDSPNLRLVYV